MGELLRFGNLQLVHTPNFMMRVFYLSMLVLFFVVHCVGSEENKRDAWFRCALLASDQDLHSCGPDPGPTEEEPHRSHQIYPRYRLEHEDGETWFESLDEPGTVVWKSAGGSVALGWGKPTTAERERITEMK